MSGDLGKILLVGFVLLFGTLAWHAWRDRQASRAWPSVEGEILRSRPRTHNVSESQIATPNHDWDVELSYQYVVNGTTYTGHRLQAIGPRYFSEQEAAQALLPFPVGARVKVYYDPAHPQSSVLIPG